MPIAAPKPRVADRPVVLDASALLALLRGEAGAEAVLAALPNACMSTVNLAEVASKLADHGMPAEAIESAVQGIRLDLRDFDTASAHRVGELRGITRAAGFSLGDRACLALAQQLGAAAMTADRSWRRLSVAGIQVELIR